MLSDAHLSFSIDPIKDLENFLSLKKKQRNNKDCNNFNKKCSFPNHVHHLRYLSQL